MAKFFTPTRLSENIAETPEGFLLCLAVPIARTGWQDYGPGETPLEVGNDNLVWVYRSSEEVFRPQTIASFQAKSITIRHPKDFVAPENWKELTYGSIQNVRKGDELDENGEEMLLADLLITDDMAIGLVKNGLREVSCGYEAEYEQTGEGEGRQYNIVGNHCALVEEGRAGPTYAINDHKGDSMSKWDEVKKTLAGLMKTADAAAKLEEKKAAKKKTADAEEKLAGAKGADDGEGVSLDEVMKAVKDLADKIDGKGKDEEKEEKESSEDEEEEKSKDDKEDGDEKEEKSDDEEESEDEDGSVEDRLKALEAAVAKILKGMSSKDEDGEESDMSGDEEEKKEKAADAKKRTGLEGSKNQKKAKDVADEQEKQFSKDSVARGKTPEEMNEINAAYWAAKK